MFEPDDIDALAHRIAYSYARSDIECFTQQITFGAGQRPTFDLEDIDEDYAEEVAIAIRYLEARGLLDRKVDNPQHVRILDDPNEARRIPEFLRAQSSLSKAA